jgi:hypothetical protein
MSGELWKEIPVFIHGITLEEKPTNIIDDYTTLLANLNKALQGQRKPPLSINDAVFIQWGHQDSTGKARGLAKAEALVAKQVARASKKPKDWPSLPGILTTRWLLYKKVREAFLNGFADLFFYVSPFGEEIIRQDVFEAISREFFAKHQDRGLNYSLTFFAHSAGSVITHDLLYHIFGKTGGGIKGAGNQEYDTHLLEFRDMVNRERLRVRRFFSMGSPITPLIFRSQTLYKRITSSTNACVIDPRDLGFSPDPELRKARFVNFWDKDDVLSYPLQFFYKKVDGKKMVEDKYVDVGDVFPFCHSYYWRSTKMARFMAEYY